MKISPVREYILNNLTQHQKDIVKRVIRKFGLSRQAVLRHMYVLIQGGKVTAYGKTKDRYYELNPIVSKTVTITITPNLEEDNTGLTFAGEVGALLKKMLLAINIKKENIYSTYAVNFRPPEDRKPTSIEIKRYSQFLQKHISIIRPKIIILMGSTAMEALTGLNSKISIERGKWKEVIVKNTNYNVIITFNPSYLLRLPENKKHSWEDLKKIKEKITDLNLNI